MNEKQVLDWLATQLGMANIHEDFLELLDEDIVTYACGGSDQRQDLLVHAKRRRKSALSLAARESSGELSSAATETRVLEPPALDLRSTGTILGLTEPIDALDQAQTLAFSSIVAAEAARHPTVMEVRKRILGSRILNADQFLCFVMSPANRLLSVSDLESRGICPVTHDARVTESSITDGLTDVTVYSSHQEFTMTSQPGDTAKAQWVTVELQHLDQVERIERNTTDRGVTILYLAPDPENAEQVGFGQITAWPGSAIAELLSVAESLSNEHPWRVPEAFTFLLTGMFPVLNSVASTISYYSSNNSKFRHARINISAVPWASSETILARLFAEQEFLLMSKKRSFGTKNLTLVMFVTNQLVLNHLSNDSPTKWTPIRNEWNQKYPGWAYTDPVYLRNDYYRTRKRIQFYPSVFPETPEEELVRYDQLKRQIWYGPMLVNPAGGANS